MRVVKILFAVLLSTVFCVSAVPVHAESTLVIPDMNLSVSYKGTSKKITLSWSAKTKDSYDGIRIYRKEKDGSYGSYYKEISCDESSFTDKVNDGVLYVYKIRAFRFDYNGKRVYGNYSKTVKAQRFKLKDTITNDQRKVAPNGCELFALSNFLGYHGIEVDGLTLCKEVTIERSPYWKDGVRYGGNPNRGYLAPKGADASSPYGWGVYKDPILKLAKKYRKKGLTDLTGSSLDEVLAFVAEHGAVEIWGTMYNEQIRDTHNSWTDEKTGKKFSWKSNMHAMTVVGFTKDQIAISDSLKNAIVWYDRAIFETNYNWLGKQAIGYKD